MRSRHYSIEAQQRRREQNRAWHKNHPAPRRHAVRLPIRRRARFVDPPQTRVQTPLTARVYLPPPGQIVYSLLYTVMK